MLLKPQVYLLHMRVYLAFLFVFSCMLCFMEITAQETAPVPVRTPEQEAVLQTQKMQKELHLNTVQQQAIYEINLKYARERQVSNSRTQALERAKNKNSAIKQVLTLDQYDQLQNKRYERYPTGSNSYMNRTLPQQQQNHPTRKQRNIETVTPQINDNVIRTPHRTVPIDPTIRNTPTTVPTRDRTTVRSPSNISGNSERSQRR